MTWDTSHLLPKAWTDTCLPQCMSATATDPVLRAKHCQGLGLINRWPDTEQKHEANKGKGREQKWRGAASDNEKHKWEDGWEPSVLAVWTDYLIWSSLPQNQSNLPHRADRGKNQTANPAQKGSWCKTEWGNSRLWSIVVGMQTITARELCFILKKNSHLHSLNLEVELGGYVSCCSCRFWIRHHIL